MTKLSLERSIQTGLLILLAVMPFHAFLSVWLGSLTGQQAIIQAWKEVLLATLALMTIALVHREPVRLQRLRQPWVILASCFTVLMLTVTAFVHPHAVTIAFGLKTDLEFLVAGVIATCVAAPAFLRRVIGVTIISSGGVIGFGLVQTFALPPNFLTHFGYGPDTILPYQHLTKGAHALRFPSTLGGPNQLGTYLILPLCLALSGALLRHKRRLILLLAGGLIVLVGTQSRSAWIGALAALTITLIANASHRYRRPLAWSLVGVGVIALLALPFLLKPDGQLQYYLLHSSVAGHDQYTSDTQHASSLVTGSQAVINEPLGHGLGSAGPATFHGSANNINVIESYYLQIGYEGGLLAMLLFLALIAALMYSLWRHAPNAPTALVATAAVFGISLVALVLPAWTDSSTSLIVWITAGTLTGLANHRV